MHNRIVIVNSTPIISLSSIDRLEILKSLYGEITIPKAVNDEVMAKQDSKSQLSLARAKDWISIRSIANSEAKKVFKVQLHDGEVEVMILGKELDADLLIIDDYLAREYAKYLEFRVTGTLGVILKARERGIVKEVKPLITDLKDNGIYIGDKLFTDVLKIAGE